MDLPPWHLPVKTITYDRHLQKQIFYLQKSQKWQRFYKMEPWEVLLFHTGVGKLWLHAYNALPYLLSFPIEKVPVISHF